MRKTLFSTLAVLMSLATLLSACAADTSPTPQAGTDAWFGAIPWELPSDAVKMRVDKVHDGDSINLTRPNDTWWEKYRIVGIQAPEIQGYKDAECFGPESASFLQELLPQGTVVWVQQDISDKDPNGRFLRHVFIQDERTGEYYLLSEVMVRGGYARERYYAPDDLYRDVLLEAQDAAWQHPTNMWICKEWKPLIKNLRDLRAQDSTPASG